MRSCFYTGLSTQLIARLSARGVIFRFSYTLSENIDETCSGLNSKLSYMKNARGRTAREHESCTERAEQKNVQFELDEIHFLVEIGKAGIPKMLVSANSAKKQRTIRVEILMDFLHLL